MLRKRLFLLIALTTIFAFGLIFATTIFATAPPVSVTVDGQQVQFDDQQPVIIDGRTLVPVRGVFEALGFNVDWNPDAKQVTLASDEHFVTLTIGNDTFTTNESNYTLDVPAQIIEGRTMLPIRAVLESVGYHVYWNNSTRTVIVSSLSAQEILVKSEEVMRTFTDFEMIFEMYMAGTDILGRNPFSTHTVMKTSFIKEPFALRIDMQMNMLIDAEYVPINMYIYVFHQDTIILTYSYMYMGGTYGTRWWVDIVPFSDEHISQQANVQLESFQIFSELLKSVEIIGEEIINGVNCWKLKVTLDILGMIEIANELLDSPVNIDANTLNSLIEKENMKTAILWIAQDGFYQMRIDLDLFDIIASTMRHIGDEISTVTYSMKFFNFNNVPPIILPEEAYNAPLFRLPNL